MPPEEVLFFSIATNNYLAHWQSQILDVQNALRELGWKWVLMTDKVDEAEAFLEQASLGGSVRVVSALPMHFPLASMIRYPAILAHCRSPGWICYMDADMKIENPEQLDRVIRASTLPTVVAHPGYSRALGDTVTSGIKVLTSHILASWVEGGNGTWEKRRRSKAFVPRRLRKTYVAGGIFFGPSSDIERLSSNCWEWTEADLRQGIVARWHDESYLNRWTAINPHSLVGPEYCFYDFPWLGGLGVVVRAVDKSKV